MYIPARKTDKFSQLWKKSSAMNVVALGTNVLVVSQLNMWRCMWLVTSEDAWKVRSAWYARDPIFHLIVCGYASEAKNLAINHIMVTHCIAGDVFEDCRSSVGDDSPRRYLRWGYGFEIRHKNISLKELIRMEVTSHGTGARLCCTEIQRIALSYSSISIMICVCISQLQS